MSVISVFDGLFCLKDPVVRRVLSETGHKLITDNEIVARAAALSGLSEGKIRRAMTAKTSVFNKFTREKELSLAWLKLATAETLTQDGLLFSGFTGMMIPQSVTHVLRICLIADLNYRTQVAAQNEGLSHREALKAIKTRDEDFAAMVKTLTGNDDPWDPSLYDIVIPMDKTSVEQAADLIVENLDKTILKTTDASMRRAADFLLASRVEVALVKEGHDVSVDAVADKVILTIHKNVMMLHRLETELKELAGKVDGVGSVEVKVGKDFHQTDIYRKIDLELPSKVLLVDDEREFVQTLSERLEMRDMGSHVVYDGESALSMVSEEEPEVMILDLKMPGIDGIEVLRRVKSENPEIEVIILTGHGSEEDRETCMKLGAFAYLQKPVDIEVLSETLKQANEKIRSKKES